MGFKGACNFASLHLSVHSWKCKPYHKESRQQSQNNWLQDLNTFGLGDSSNGKGKQCRSATASCSSESNRCHMEMLREKSRNSDYRGREERPNEKTLQTNSDGRHVELWHKPKQ